MLKDIVLEGELLKSKALDQFDPDLSEADFIDKVYEDVKEWMERAKKVLSSKYPNQSINLDEPSWDSIISRSREALAGFVENRLLKLRPLLNASMTFDRIMSALLQTYEAHPEMDVEEIIAQVAQEMGTSKKSMENIKSSLSLLEKMQEKKFSMEAAHENGDTTKKWILAETEKLTEGRSDKERAAIAEGVAKAVDRGVQQSISGDEPTKKEE